MARVVRNDWSSLAVPDLAGWRPTMTVSVIIPAYRCQETLDLTLASLRRQTYPPELLEVVVVDDGSDPPLCLPPLRPARTRLVRVDGDGWGRANALRAGVAASTGEILHWLDADMVAFPEHVAAQARWHHVVPYAVTLGYKRFVAAAADGGWPAPEAVDRVESLFDSGEPHHYVERYIAQTDQLRTADHLAFKIHVGATAALRRELYEAAGGFDATLRLGEDTEFGYRLAQAGAVFVPEPAARSWHLGLTHVMRHRAEVARWNRPFLADRIPHPRGWRRVGGPTWTVPLAEVVVPVGDEPVERVRTAVDAVLRGTTPDVAVTLVGPWDKLDGGRVRVLTDPHRDLRLIAATYRGEPRVRLATESPESAFPAPYLVELPPTYALAPDAVRRLTDLADRHRAGAVRVAPPDGPPIVLWRTAARSRAALVRTAGEPLLDAVAAVHGRRDATPEEIGVLDLSPFTPEDLTRGVTWTGRRRTARAEVVPSMVEVEGVRSLARATVVVAWLAGRRAAAFLRPRR